MRPTPQHIYSAFISHTTMGHARNCISQLSGVSCMQKIFTSTKTHTPFHGCWYSYISMKNNICITQIWSPREMYHKMSVYQRDRSAQDERIWHASTGFGLASLLLPSPTCPKPVSIAVSDTIQSMLMARSNMMVQQKAYLILVPPLLWVVPTCLCIENNESEYINLTTQQHHIYIWDDAQQRVPIRRNMYHSHAWFWNMPTESQHMNVVWISFSQHCSCLLFIPRRTMRIAD